MGIPKTSDNIQIWIKMPNPNQEPRATSKAPNKDLKDLDVLCALKIKIESKNLDYGYVRDQWPYPNKDLDAKPQSETSSILKSPKSGLKDMDVLFIFKIKIESQNSEIWCVNHQWSYPNQSKDAKPESGTPNVLQNPN